MEYPYTGPNYGRMKNPDYLSNMEIVRINLENIRFYWNDYVTADYY